MTTDTAQSSLHKVRTQAHFNCAVCGSWNARGLGLDFTLSEDGGVQACFCCGKDFEGYAGLLHGGVIATVLDGAMTNCMFAHGCPSVTAELNVRFRHPVVTDTAATVRAWIDRSEPPLHVLKAQIVQDGQVKATSLGKFMEQPRITTSRDETT